MKELVLPLRGIVGGIEVVTRRHGDRALIGYTTDVNWMLSLLTVER